MAEPDKLNGGAGAGRHDRAKVSDAHGASGARLMGNAEPARLEGFGKYGDGTQRRKIEDRPDAETDDGNRSYWGNHRIECYDGKARRTEPSICFLVDGISWPLDLLRQQIFADIQKEVRNYAPIKRQSAEALRELWRKHVEEEVRKAEPLGVQFGVRKATFLYAELFNFMASQEPANAECCLFSGAGAAAIEGDMRVVLKQIGATDTPRRPQPDEQRDGKLTDSMLVLSRFLASSIETIWEAQSEYADAEDNLTFPKNRIEAWRIAGNAIVPQLAVEFIKSVRGN